MIVECIDACQLRVQVAKNVGKFMPLEELIGSAQDYELPRMNICFEKYWQAASWPINLLDSGKKKKDSLEIQTLCMIKASSGNASGEWCRRVILQFLFLFDVCLYAFIT